MKRVSIIPCPVTLIERGSPLPLGPGTVIATTQESAAIAAQLQARLRAATGLPLDTVRLGSEPAGAIVLDLDYSLGAGAYTVAVDENGARLRGGDGEGLFHATQTFLQLMPPAVFRRVPLPDVTWEVPGVEIADRPRFGWRGMLLDLSRHFFGRDSILRLIDVLALHRMNVLHLHLTDDQGWRLQIERFPLLTEVGSWRPHSVIDNRYIRPEGAEPVRDFAPHDGFLTQDDVREIVAYAAQRYITVVPEIDLPGHSQAAIASYPELGNTGEQLGVWTDWGVSPHVLNAEESTMRFYEQVLDEILELFPSTFVHVGGDEVPKDEWRTSPAAQRRIRELGLADESALHGWMLDRFSRYLAARGRRLVGWDEILEVGSPEGAVVMSWRGQEGGVAAAGLGHDVVMAPDPTTYLYHPQSDELGAQPLAASPAVTLGEVLAYDPMPADLDEGARRHVLGAQCQMWTEFVSSERQLHALVFPRLCAFAEAVWRPEGPAAEEAEFRSRLEVHVERLHACGIDAYRAG